MDTISYILFKNPVTTYSVTGVKYTVDAISGIFRSSSSSSYTSNPKLDLIKMLDINRNYFRLSGVLGATAVVLGAYGAHTLLAKDGNEQEKKIFDTASRYHFYHTVGLLASPFCRYPKLTAATMTLGILIFCGSCYYQSLTGDDTYRKITPYGGTMLIIAWLTMIL